MQEKEIIKQIRGLIRIEEDNLMTLMTLESNDILDALLHQDISLNEIIEDASNPVRSIVSSLQHARLSNQEIIQIMRESAKIETCTLNVVENEMASRVVGKRVTYVPESLSKAIDMLSADRLEKIQALLNVRMIDSQKMEIDFSVDRLVLRLNEDLFAETSRVYLRHRVF